MMSEFCFAVESQTLTILSLQYKQNLVPTILTAAEIGRIINRSFYSYAVLRLISSSEAVDKIE